jgi:glucose/arabinose dehydrogenase
MKLILLLIVTLLAACSGTTATPTATPTMTDEGSNTPTKQEPEFQVIAKKLQAPWAIDFNGENIYISERNGAVVKIDGATFTRQKLKLTKAVNHVGEGGFLGFLLAPDYSTTKQAYAYYTYKEDGNTYNRVVLLQESAEGWQEIKVFIERIPGSNAHNGGRLAYGPDHNLYITTGDSTKGELAQDIKSLGGKILRMTLDGAIPQDNPFANSYVYSYGHRNSQGIAWDSQGQMYETEHGPSGSPGGHDEINRIEPGKNYGWPTIIGDEKHEGMVNPLYHTGDPAIAPSGIVINSDDQILIAALRGQKLFKYDPKSNQMNVILENQGRLRDVKIHNGKIYVITNNTDGRGVPSDNDDRLLLLNK